MEAFAELPASYGEAYARLSRLDVEALTEAGRGLELAEALAEVTAMIREIVPRHKSNDNMYTQALATLAALRSGLEGYYRVVSVRMSGTLQDALQAAANPGHTEEPPSKKPRTAEDAQALLEREIEHFHREQTMRDERRRIMDEAEREAQASLAQHRKHLQALQDCLRERKEAVQRFDAEEARLKAELEQLAREREDHDARSQEEEARLLDAL